MVAGHLQEKNGYYYVVLNYMDALGNRHQIWRGTGLTVTGNKRKAAKLLQEMRESFVVPEVEPLKECVKHELSPDMLFIEFAKIWLDIVRTTVAETTFSGYQLMVNRKILPYFAPMRLKLSEVKPIHIQQFYLHEYKTVKGTSVRHEHALMHKMLKYACRMDLIASNPTEKVEVPKAEPFEGVMLSEEELQDLINKAWGTKLGLLIYVTAVLGLRRSEALGLRWEAIDFEENTITINHTITDCKVDGKSKLCKSDRTKTKSSYRTFPMSDAMKEKLLEWRKVQEENKEMCGRAYNMKDAAYVFTDEFGNVIRPGYIDHAFPKLLQDFGIRKIRFHDLRHTCASLMHKSGMSVKEIQEYLGHSNITTTMNIYTHLDWDSKENASKVMNSLVKAPEGTSGTGWKR